VLTPTEALRRFRIAREKVDNLTTVGIAGPGDALADWDNTKATLALLQSEDQNVNFCLSTNGLLLPRYASELVGLGVTHVTVTVNAIDASIGAKIYKFVRMGELTYVGEAGAAVLLSNQIEGIKRLIELGVVVKVNTVLISGVNDSHVEKVSEFMATLGVSVHNIMQMVPVKGAVFGELPQVSRHVLDTVRAQCAEYLPQMHHCQQCRADAVGKLTENLLPFIEEAEGSRTVSTPIEATNVVVAVVPDATSAPFSGGRAQLAPTKGLRTAVGVRPLSKGASGTGSTQHAGCHPGEQILRTHKTASCRPLDLRAPMRVAVASRSGMMVDTHFGHAKDFLVYEVDEHSLRFVERRNTETFCKGNDYCADDEQENRLDKTIATISDCKAVVCLRIGHAPQAKLKAQGIVVLTNCDSIEEAVRAAREKLIAELQAEKAPEAFEMASSS
jgi:MoaA/NifB/PqqE/SkfB family radical SAM enzyme